MGQARRGFGFFLAVLVVVAAAAADDTTAAKQRFAEGVDAFARGEHAAAAASFAEAFALAPRGATAYNEGLAWQAASDSARAADAFWTALRMGGLTDEQRSEAEKRYSALRSRVGEVTVEAPPGTLLTLAGRKDRPAPLHMHLEPGTYQLEAAFPDRQVARREVVVGAGSVTVIIAPAEPGFVPSSRPAPAPSSHGTIRDGAAANSASGVPVLGWIAFGGSVACAGTAAYLGLEALQARDRYFDSGFTDAEARDRAAGYRTWTNVAWASAGVLAGVGILSVVRGRDANGATATGRGARARFGAGQLWVEGTF